MRLALVIAAKDLRAEMRTKEAVNASLAFSVVILALFSFAFDPDGDMMREISGGLLWLVFAFAGALVLNRSFSRELPNDCLDGLIAAPISGGSLFLGKALANFALLLAVELISLPIFGIFYNVRWTPQFASLLLVLLLGTWGLTLIGTFASVLTVNIRLREVMLPMLTYPLMVPVLMGSMHVSTVLLGGSPMGDPEMLWIKMMLGFDAAFTAASLVFVEYILVG